MAIANDLHRLFEARLEFFEIVDGHPTDANVHHIVEERANLLYPIQFDKEGGKHNLISLIIDNDDYTERFGTPFPCLKRPSIYDESIADGVTGVIRTKAKAIHRARITDWDTLESAEREAQSFLIDAFDKCVILRAVRDGYLLCTGDENADA